MLQEKYKNFARTALDLPTEGIDVARDVGFARRREEVAIGASRTAKGDVNVYSCHVKKKTFGFSSTKIMLFSQKKRKR